MLLCDIGNTSYHFYDGVHEKKEDAASFDPRTVKEKVYYICVNGAVLQKLSPLANWVNLERHVDRSRYYETMGIDRIMACEAIKNGIVIDAGSAITVDKVQEGVFAGGFIYPGVRAMEQTYKNISSALDYSFNYKVDLDKMPKNSQDAISYGYLKPLQAEVLSHNTELILTGGDARKLACVFPRATIDELLLFGGMQKIIQRAKLC